jgi:hypothetical protein
MEDSSFYKGKNYRNNMRKTEVKLSSKRAQLTLFIILGLVLIVGIILFFIYVLPNFSNSSSKLSIESCVTDAVKKEIPILSETAGLINPTFNTLYQDENYTFICYTDEYYKPCVVQVPFLTTQFENSLNLRLNKKIIDCYEKSVDKLESEGYTVLRGTLTSKITIQPTQVLVSISAPTSISSEDSSQTQEDFEVEIPSDLFNVLSVANSLLQFEVTYGDTDTSPFRLYYPNIGLDKVRRDDGIKLYTLDNKKDIKFKFAVRSYAWPPGYG